MATEFDEGYWPPVDPIKELAANVAEHVKRHKVVRVAKMGLDGKHISEQIIAGVALLIIGASTAHAYAEYRQSKR